MPIFTRYVVVSCAGSGPSSKSGAVAAYLADEIAAYYDALETAVYYDTYYLYAEEEGGNEAPALEKTLGLQADAGHHPVILFPCTSCPASGVGICVCLPVPVCCSHRDH